MTSLSENKSKVEANYEISSWEDENLNLKLSLLRGIYSFGFEKPSSVQKKVLYPMTKNLYKQRLKDIIAQAQSGTGKTGAFVIGALQTIVEDLKELQILILAPTHELAIQTHNVVKNLSHYMKIESLLLVGGTSVEKNKKDIKEKKPQIIVGTPGRVHDMMRRRYLRVDKITMIILDEADEMLGRGFKDQMYKIFTFMPNEVQIGLFSATLSNEVLELADSFMKSPTKILVTADQLTLQGIAQYYINLTGDEQKFDCIKDIFSAINVSQAIIYCNSVNRVDDLEEAMLADNFPVKKIHGKMIDGERKTIYKDFKTGGCRVLITSDLFARGIDVQQVSIVINFDIPRNENTYLHRIGRSGRWGRKGIAINFQTKYDINKLQRFKDFYKTEIKEMPSNFIDHLNAV
jgi:translation initiation factor 4A